MKYDEKGDAVGLSKTQMVAKGLIPNAVIIKTNDTSASPTFYKIKVLEDDGAIRLKQLDDEGNEKGALTKSPFDTAIQKYKIGKPSFRKVLQFPLKDVTKSVDFVLGMATAQVSLQMCKAYDHHKDVNVSIIEKPNKGVEVNEPFARRKLLIPLYGVIEYCKTAKYIASSRKFVVKGVDISFPHFVRNLRRNSKRIGGLQPCI